MPYTIHMCVTLQVNMHTLSVHVHCSGGHPCECLPGFTGNDCGTWDPCVDRECGNGGTCLTLGDCTCMYMSMYPHLSIYLACTRARIVYVNHVSEYTVKVHISIWNLLKNLRLNCLQNFVICNQHQNIYGNGCQNQFVTNSQWNVIDYRQRVNITGA